MYITISMGKHLCHVSPNHSGLNQEDNFATDSSYFALEHASRYTQGKGKNWNLFMLVASIYRRRI